MLNKTKVRQAVTKFPKLSERALMTSRLLWVGKPSYVTLFPSDAILVFSDLKRNAPRQKITNKNTPTTNTIRVRVCESLCVRE